ILAFSIIIGIASIFIEKNFPDNFTNSFNNLYLFICGFLMSIGVVVPGISSTVILMLLGIYPLYLESVSHINLHFLFPMGLGLLFRWIYFYEIN
ncbi:MAG: DUF368 domain-containing protein, partial [Clostridia bacterium]|nr:DUF368 domain-containing protein [Clostridia bacterium]